MKSTYSKLALTLAVLIPTFALGVDWSGYLRNDVTITEHREEITRRSGYRLGNFMRLRLTLDAEVNESVYVSATPEFTYLSGDRLRDPYFGTPYDEYKVDLSRGQLDYYADWLQLTLGKQRLKISTAMFFSPLDIFNPVDISEPKSERAGVLSGRATIYAFGDNGARIIFVPEELWQDSPKAIRLFAVLGGFDIGASYAEPGYYDIGLAGADFSSSLGDFGLYGEGVYEISNTEEDIENGNARGTFGVNYGWDGGPSIFLEYYHDERGGSEPIEYNLEEYVLGHRSTLGRDYGGVRISYELRPLIILAVAGVMNISDESYYVNPSALWNPLENLEILTEVDYFNGDKYSEYYFLLPTYRLQVSAYF